MAPSFLYETFICVGIQIVLFTVYCFRFRHPNLVTLLGYSNDVGKPRCLIYEFMPNGTLEDALELGVCQSTHRGSYRVFVREWKELIVHLKHTVGGEGVVVFKFMPQRLLLVACEAPKGL